MGAFTSLAARRIVPNQGKQQNLWNEVFGVSGEDKLRNRAAQSRPNPVPGGSYGRSISSTEGAFKRLLQAMRSMAPGGWSDDRYAESRAFIGISYVSIHRIATMWQQSEFAVMRKDDDHPDGKVPVKKGEPGYKLVELLEKPNKQDSFGKMCYRWCQQKYLTGTALTWMIPNVFGVPVEMYTIPTAIAIPQPAVNPDYPDGFYRIQPLYPYGPFSSYPTPASAVGAAVPAEWMLRFQFPHPLLRYEGYSPLTGLNLHIDAVEMIDRSRHALMRRAIQPSAVVNFKDMENMQPLPTSEIDRIIAEFEAAFQGSENAGHLMVAPPGGEIAPWGQTPAEMSYKEGWEQLTSFVMGGLGITKEVAGMAGESSYSALYAALKQFYFQELEPGLNDLASDLTRMLAPFFGDDLMVEIRGRQINDHDIATSKITSGMSAKCITKNEVRKLLDMPVTQEEWGDEIAGSDPQAEQQAAMQQQQAAGGGEEGTGDPEEDAEFAQLESEFSDEADNGEATADEDENEVEEDRESPGKLSEGALGPRKFLGRRNLSFMNGMNGHAKKLALNGRK